MKILVDGLLFGASECGVRTVEVFRGGAPQPRPSIGTTSTPARTGVGLAASRSEIAWAGAAATGPTAGRTACGRSRSAVADHPHATSFDTAGKVPPRPRRRGPQEACPTWSRRIFCFRGHPLLGSRGRALANAGAMGFVRGPVDTACEVGYLPTTSSVHGAPDGSTLGQLGIHDQGDAEWVAGRGLAYWPSECRRSPVDKRPSSRVSPLLSLVWSDVLRALRAPVRAPTPVMSPSPNAARGHRRPMWRR